MDSKIKEVFYLFLKMNTTFDYMNKNNRGGSSIPEKES